MNAQTKKLTHCQSNNATDILESMIDHERVSLARELHDQFSQNLTAISLHAYAIKDCGTKKCSQEHAEAIERLTHDSVRELKDIISGLRATYEHSNKLSLFNKIASIKEFWHNVDATLNIELELSGCIDSSHKHTDTAYKIIQEAITNIFRHANATWVKVSIQVDSGSLKILICDDGVGFPKNEMNSSDGLIGMRERVELAKGDIQIYSQEGIGTLIAVELPG